jgi:branched-chain amino acid transport system substrate-binding protein
MVRHFLAIVIMLLPALARAKIPEDKIKIGVLQDLQQPYADATGNGGIVAAQLAAADFEKEYLKGDAEILPDASQGGIDADLDQVRDWLDKEHVAAVLSSAGNALNQRIAKLVEARHRTLLVAEDVAGPAEKLCSPSVVVWSAGTAARVRAMVQVLASQNRRRWYLVVEQDPAGVASEAALQDAVAAVGGQIVGKTQRIVGNVDFSDTLAAIDKANPDAVLLGEGDGELVTTLRSLTLAQPRHPVSLAAPTASLVNIDQAGPAAADGLLVTAAFYWDADQQSRRFAQRWESRMHGQHVTQNAATVYAATLSFLHAAKAADDVDAGKVRAELRRAPIKNTLFGTATVRDDGQALYDLDVYRVKDPDQIQQRWAYYTAVAKVPAAQGFPSSPCSNGVASDAAEPLTQAGR